MGSHTSDDSPGNVSASTSAYEGQTQAQSQTNGQGQSGDRFKRLAAKPLKLAASTFKSGSRSLSRAASSEVLSTSSSMTVIPNAGAQYTSESKAQDHGGASEATDVHVSPRRRRRRGLRLKGRHTSTDPTQAALAAKGPRKPLEGEDPAAWVRVRIVKAEGLVAKDRNGTSDPFVSVVIPPSPRQTTSVIKKTLAPEFSADHSTFDFPLYLSLAAVVGGRGLEGVVWDKDLMRKEYMGEFALPIIDWFEGGDVKLWSPDLPLIRRRLRSTRRRHDVSGIVHLQLGFLPPKGAASEEDAVKQVKRIHGVFAEQSSVARGLAGVLGVPAHQGIGTVRARAKDDGDRSLPPAHLDDSKLSATIESLYGATDPKSTKSSRLHHLLGRMDVKDDDSSDSSDDELALQDDGLSDSSDEESDDVAGTDVLADHRDLTKSPEAFSKMEDGLKTAVPPPKSGEEQVPKSAGLLAPTTAAQRMPPSRQTSLPGYFDRQKGETEASTPGTPGTAGSTTPGGTRRRPIFKKHKSQMSTKRSTRDFNFDANKGRDTLGIVVMEILSATDLPRIKNSLKFGFDMDPFVVIAFGQKVFRTRVIRHSLNPTWEEKLLFHVRRHEANYTVGFSVLDWDKVSGNDMIGTCTLPLAELMSRAPKADPETGLHGKNDDGKHDMAEFTLPLVCDKDMPWESKHSPKITVRAKYEPYDALRQRFWRQYCLQYDADDTGSISYTELTTMLDSLGSTLTKTTLESYFTMNGKDPNEDELTFDEVVICLEREVEKQGSEKQKISKKHGRGLVTESPTPPVAAEPQSQGLDMTGPQGDISSPVDPDELEQHIIASQPRDRSESSEQPGNQVSVPGGAEAIPALRVDRTPSVDLQSSAPLGVSLPESEASSGIATEASSEADLEVDVDTEVQSEMDDTFDAEGASPTGNVERVINIRTCPLCHRRRLKKRSEQDIVTHLAICASADWSRVDRIVTANYVTSSQAQRKFFTKLVNKVAIGSYSLGANSANILVQDRMTGQLQEEKMAVYVRVGIRVLYKGARSRMEGARARKLLKSLSVKQGLKYDSPSSAVDIPTFISFHNLDVNEIRDPLDSFKTFNEFFYRKLKPDARPVSDPGDDGRLVSCADCRMMAFETVSEATNIWIKGREFSVARLLGPNYADVVDRYEGGALGIFRLAPQDYHRFHSPVKGKIGKMTMIDGEYYTVNPQAIRTGLDVYGENVRKVVPIQSEDFGLVMTVWVGAMMVGSIATTVEEGQTVQRADELGYFAFGGSTIVCIFEKGALKWDDDLIDNGRASIETLVRMGMGIGRSTRSTTASAAA